MEFPRTASQNVNYTSSSNSLLLICFFYSGPSLILSVINMATQRPVVERLYSEWTINPFWLDCLWAYCILSSFCSLIPLLSILSHSLLSLQVSLLEHPDSSSILCEPSQTHSHFFYSKYSSFDSPNYMYDSSSIFTFMILDCWLFIGSWSFEAISFLGSTITLAPSRNHCYWPSIFPDIFLTLLIILTKVTPLWLPPRNFIALNYYMIFLYYHSLV